jgi:hypothetical protein
VVQGLGVGAVAGGLGALLTTPLDVVKVRGRACAGWRVRGFSARLTWHGALVQTRWMVDGKSYRGLTDVIVSTWSLEGPSAFFKGAV